MSEFSRDRLTGLVDRLGRCARCTNAAFGSFALAALTTCVLLLLGVRTAVLVPVAVLALVLAAVWIAHVFMFTLRSARATARLTARGTPTVSVPWTRRRLVAAFLRLLAFSAAAAVLPRSVFGQSSCNCYEDSDCYCPPEFPNCVYNPTTREAICCGPSDNGCAGPSSTWCCPSGSDCYGTDNQCY